MYPPHEHYVEIGRKGGSAPHVIRGFQAMPSWKVSLAGQLGGKISRRGKSGRANPLSLTERQRIKKEFEKNYAHLLKIHESR